MTHNTDIKNQTNPMSGDLLRQIIRLGFRSQSKARLSRYWHWLMFSWLVTLVKKRQRLWELRQNGISWRS